MKKILIYLATICCVGCIEYPQKAVQTEEVHSLSPNTRMRYIEFDGHQFIEYKIGSVHGGGSLCHSPKCPCLEQYKNNNKEF